MLGPLIHFRQIDGNFATSRCNLFQFLIRADRLDIVIALQRNRPQVPVIFRDFGCRDLAARQRYLQPLFEQGIVLGGKAKIDGRLADRQDIIRRGLGCIRDRQLRCCPNQIAAGLRLLRGDQSNLDSLGILRAGRLCFLLGGESRA